MSLTNIPVLFITFARPEYARQTFDGIKQAKPTKLYFYSNKARMDNPIELDNNNLIRSFINEIDWQCELKTYFRDEHVDIYTSLWSALDWVFDNEEQAIILEEDCVPSLAFFNFCSKLLPMYKDDMRIWVISGNNFIEGYNPNGVDYIFSRFTYMYGWASWQSRWKKLERKEIPWESMKKYGINEQLFSLNKRKTAFIIKAHEKIFNLLKSKPAWDLTFGFTIVKEGGFGIVPAINLVSNIGLIGTHNKSGSIGLVNCRAIPSEPEYVINYHPPFVVPDYYYDQRLFYVMFYKKSLLHIRIINKFRRGVVKFKNILNLNSIY